MKVDAYQVRACPPDGAWAAAQKGVWEAMDSSACVESLCSISLFGDMPKEARLRIASLFVEVSREMEFADGVALFHQGDLGADAGFVLTHGRALVEREGAPPVRIEPPALLGEIQQFSPRAQRIATVRADGVAKVLRFSWQDLYKRARATLSEGEQHSLMDALEKGVCERLACENLIDVPIFRGAPEGLRIRASLVLHWLAHRVQVADGALLFEQSAFCGGEGFLLLEGCVGLSIAGKPSRKLHPPAVLGIMPDFDPEARWTVRATAEGSTDLLKFSWPEYMATLRQRLSPAELGQLRQSFTKAGDGCLPH